ncbi:nucleic acid/nucleotide deaminase domain-containing protein [Streptacidiphilus anmyonensis]|uniref:nucleic acid/nucleotide deaminase domain-containing protein n=1 Tax=Streptacidiphilus anmyonensis TaxID=405782 RepID=UPI0005AA7AF1|nr:nucleic acid/nucleotide deaminase domain-containing protein [Streptacidiphilus anmyonensis]
MSTDPRRALVERFGVQGLRRLAWPAEAGPVGVGFAAVAEVGVPVQVGRYFSAPDAADAVGGTGADAQSAPLTAEARPVLGYDGPVELYVTSDGGVRGSFDGYALPEMPVNSSVDRLLLCLTALDKAMPLIAGAEDQGGALAVYRELRAELMSVDEEAFADREGWWPRILDDLRHPLNVRSSAAIGYQDADGQEQILVATTGPGLPHAEEIAWDRLAAAGVPGEAVTSVFTELQACFMPGHWCALWMSAEFPQARLTHRFDYGRDAESREAGVKALMMHILEQD